MVPATERERRVSQAPLPHLTGKNSYSGNRKQPVKLIVPILYWFSSCFLVVFVCHSNAKMDTPEAIINYAACVGAFVFLIGSVSGFLEWSKQRKENVP